jgi:hypothetical protein
MRGTDGLLFWRVDICNRKEDNLILFLEAIAFLAFLRQNKGGT